MAVNVDYFEKINRILGNLIDKGERKFIIYPFGDRGRLVKRILNYEYGIKEHLLLDNRKIVDGLTRILMMKDLKPEDIEGAILLLASDSPAFYSEIRKCSLEYFSLDRIVDVLSPSLFFDPGAFYDFGSFDSDHKVFPRYNITESCMREIYYHNVEGSVAECGVLRGEFAVVLSKLFPDRKLYLFDTFEGIADSYVSESERQLWNPEVLENAEGYFTNVPSMEAIVDNIPWKQNVITRKGFFPDTAIGNEEIESDEYCLVDIDMGFYEPTVAALEFFYPRVTPGGYILVDDIRHRGVDAVRQAIEEFCQSKKIGFSSVQYGIYGMACIAKPYV